MSLKVAIIGGGLGGLVAALFLSARGIAAEVYEQGSSLNEVGAGIVVPPNMVRLLRKLGLADGLGEFAIKVEYAWEFRRWQDGRILATTPMGEACERLYGAPCFVAHRADLLAMYHRALPDGVVHLDRRCVGLRQNEAGVALDFVSAEGGHTRVEADVAIGADGIHSIMRGAVTEEQSPRFSGLCAFRCLVPAERVPELALRPTHTLWLGPGRHFVHYPISAGRLVNVVAVAPAGEWRSESWTADGDIADLLAEFATWDPRLKQLIVSASETKRWAMFDRPPLDRWTAGRVALLGDAAHAMLPFLAQGAAQCAEDADVLADCLASATASTAKAALMLYEEQRRPRANQILLGSRGREIRNHLPDGPEQEKRDAELAASDPLREVAWLYGEGVERSRA
ncbi:MAG: salicylate 1-monooxygenase [Bradyrhizobium sp.]|nr:MAG: salicylate 1-monooxygenase [Bradyrhizobium sp.]